MASKTTPKPITRLDQLTLGELRSLIRSTDLPETLTVAEALDAYHANRERDAANSVANREFQREVSAWLDGREAATKEAANAARKANAKHGAPRANSAALEAGVEAAKAYERSTPRPTTTNGQPGCPLAFITEDEVGMVGRVRGALPYRGQEHRSTGDGRVSIEKATGERKGRGYFPREWGEPPEDIEKRAGWIRFNIERGLYRQRQGEEVRWLAEDPAAKPRRLLRELEKKKYGP